ncbi:MAG: hypothetical protein J6O04_01595 [Selenomonadaceae bacterium]|nr:hypothetical protein [Selenomonadaceae bacterium]
MRKKAKNKKSQKILALAFSAALATSMLGIGSPAFGAELPAFFDWRLSDPTDKSSAKDAYSIISPVRDQSLLNTCWTFAALGSYESSYMKQLLAAKAAGENITLANPDFSERYLAWMTKRKAINEANTDNIPRHGDDNTPPYASGSIAFYADATFINKGVVLENEAPYSKLFEPEKSEYEAKVAAGENKSLAYYEFSQKIAKKVKTRISAVF